MCSLAAYRKFKELSIQQDLDAIASCRATPSSCATHSKIVANAMADLDPIKDTIDYGSPKAREAVQNLINSNYEFQEMLATATTEHSVGAMVDSLKAKWGLSDAQAQAITDDLKVALAAGLGTAAGVLAYKRAVASAGKSAPIKNHNPTSDKTDSESARSEIPKKWDVPDTTIAKLPDSWNVSANKKGEGFRWQDPKNQGNGVRIDKGEPKVSQPTQQVDHVIVRYNGQVIGRDGKPVIGSIKDHAEQVHIPLSEYRKWKTWNSPN
ncbi:hypothetical protein [Pseudomonas sp. KBS0710]|uniref:hypothetical protein n=1 Tax=Pseudomonas sp. KBS0710 TaxID=1179667 RepID=UPI001C49A0DF|nr:hypothetical protein [Pseudomonas sp. KBS0710]